MGLLGDRKFKLIGPVNRPHKGNQRENTDKHNRTQAPDFHSLRSTNAMATEIIEKRQQ
jgi:hypothetical protein